MPIDHERPPAADGDDAEFPETAAYELGFRDGRESGLRDGYTEGQLRGRREALAGDGDRTSCLIATVAGVIAGVFLGVSYRWLFDALFGL